MSLLVLGGGELAGALRTGKKGRFGGGGGEERKRWLIMKE